MSGTGGTLPVRFHVQLSDGGLPCGDEATPTQTLALLCHPTESFGSIKARLWSKLGSILPASAPCPPPAEYLFELATGEMTFEDDDLLSRFLAANEIFRESAAPTGPHTPSSGNGASRESPMLECLVLHRDHVADRYTRESRPFPPPSGLLQHKGVLQVRSAGALGSKWMSRYAAIYDMVLYSWPNEAAFRKRDMTDVEFLHLGAVVATQLVPQTSDRGHNFSFELKKATAPVSQGGPAPPVTGGSQHAGKPLVFYCETDAALQGWIACVNRLYLRRVKLIVVSIVEELESRGLESSEGLFRLSANRAHVDQLQQEFDANKSPNLGLIHDEHVLANCLKNNLRNMPEPLLTFEVYPLMVRAAQDFPPSPAQDQAALMRRLDAFKAVVDRLPQTNVGLLEYLMSFLSRVAEQAHVNRMSAANLAIVFSPNILRPKVENVTTIMADSKHVLDCVEQLITHARDVWPNFTNTRRTSRLAFFTGSRPSPSSGAAAGGAAAGGAQPPSPSSTSSNSGRALPPSLPTVSETSSSSSSSSSQPSSNRTLPAGGRGGVTGPTPPPGRGGIVTSAPPAPAPAAPAEPSNAEGGARALPTGAVRLPYIPIGAVPLMMRKAAPAGGPAPPPLSNSSSAQSQSTASPSPPPAAPAVVVTSPAPVAPAPKVPVAPKESSPAPAPAPAPVPAPAAAAARAAAPAPAASAAVSTPFVSQAGPAAIAALPEEMLSLDVDCQSLNEQWVSSLTSTRANMANAMAQLLDAHALAMQSGKLTSEASASTAQTVQRCVNVLAADMARWQTEYDNLVSFVLEQSKQLPLSTPPCSSSSSSSSSASSSSSSLAVPFNNHNVRTSSATKPNRHAIAAPSKVPPPPLPQSGTGTANAVSNGPRPPPLPAPPAAQPTPSVAPPIPPLPSSVAAVAPVAPVAMPEVVLDVPPPPPDVPLTPPPLPRAETGDIVTAQFAYDGGADSLSLAVGDRLLLLEGDEADTEWWLGRRMEDNVEGYFPSAFVALS